MFKFVERRLVVIANITYARADMGGINAAAGRAAEAANRLAWMVKAHEAR